MAKVWTAEAEIRDSSPYHIRTKPFTSAPRKPDVAQGRDTFETPDYASKLLIPFIPKKIRNVWECAAGGGKIVRVLEDNFDVYSSDIRPSPFVEKVSNFVTDESAFALDDTWAIITNPPFSIKDLFIERAFEYGVPFAFLINADYSQQTINWLRRGCQKIVPTSRIAYITPNIVERVNKGEGTSYETKDEIPSPLLYKYSSAQFHSMWLTWGFDLGESEIFVDLSVEQRKNNI